MYGVFALPFCRVGAILELGTLTGVLIYVYLGIGVSYVQTCTQKYTFKVSFRKIVLRLSSFVPWIHADHSVILGLSEKVRKKSGMTANHGTHTYAKNTTNQLCAQFILVSLRPNESCIILVLLTIP